MANAIYNSFKRDIMNGSIDLDCSADFFGGEPYTIIREYTKTTD